MDEFEITLKAARINAGYTQDAAAMKIGVARSTLSNWEDGRAEPKASDFKKLCALYAIPMERIRF